MGAAKEVEIDVNLSALFKAYSILKKVKSNGEILIYYSPTKENGNYVHYDNLENVILRFFIQGYLPSELLRKVSLDTSKSEKGFINLLDENGNAFATIVNKKKHPICTDAKKDCKRFFSRIDDINHNFSKRRHSRWLI